MIKVIQADLRLKRKEYLTPHYIRVYLTGDDVKKLHDRTIGINNKILIPPKGIDQVHFPQLAADQKSWAPQDAKTAPFLRTYTHRGIDLEKNEIWIDFVAHGDEGPASAWAIRAREGDALGVMMKKGEKQLYHTQADYYLLAGDATAIPVLGAILEDLSPSARGTCLIEVHGKEDEQELYTQADMAFIWLHNPDPQKGSRLPEVFKSLSLPAANRYAYVAAEYSSVKEIRQYLKKEKKWAKDEFFTQSYWQSGKASGKSLAR